MRRPRRPNNLGNVRLTANRVALIDWNESHQASCDAVLRYNAQGVGGLTDRPRIRSSRLTEGQQAALRALVLRGPDPDRDGLSAWTRADIAYLIE